MKLKDKVAAREAAVRGVPFTCGGHSIQACPLDQHTGYDACYVCEMDSECKGEILEMCEYVNTRFFHDEYWFKFIDSCRKDKKP